MSKVSIASKAKEIEQLAAELSSSGDESDSGKSSGSDGAVAPDLLSTEALGKFQTEQSRRGVCYMSRVPPGMRPERIRQLLEDHAEIGRVYLAAEEEGARLHRVAQGGNKKLRYSQGWIEFMNKKDAREVAAMLNSQPMVTGKGSQRSHFAADLWNLKYLPRFKWQHLLLKQRFEKRLRSERLRAELSYAKRDTEAYRQQLDKSRTLHRVEERKTVEAVRSGEISARDVLERGAVAPSVAAERAVVRRHFKQLPVVSEGVAGGFGSSSSSGSSSAAVGGSGGRAGDSSGSSRGGEGGEAALGKKRPRPEAEAEADAGSKQAGAKGKGSGKQKYEGKKKGAASSGRSGSGQAAASDSRFVLSGAMADLDKGAKKQAKKQKKKKKAKKGKKDKGGSAPMQP